MSLGICLINRASQSVVFNTGQKMALRAFYFIRTLTKALTYYYIKRYLLVAIENSRFGALSVVNILKHTIAIKKKPDRQSLVFHPVFPQLKILALKLWKHLKKSCFSFLLFRRQKTMLQKAAFSSELCHFHTLW